MADEHPDRDRLERFLADRLESDERRAVVRHLLTGCAECTALTREIWASSGLGPPLERSSGAARRERTPSVAHPASYRDAFARVLERSHQREEELAGEREEAPRLVSRLLRAPAAKRRAAAEADPRLRTTPVVEILLDRSRQAAAEDPGEPVAIAELALAVAERLDPRRCGATVARELVVRAWTCLGDARRRGGERGLADRAFAAAEALRAEDGDTAYERADLTPLAADLGADRPDEAEAALLAARSSLLAAGRGRDAALASLDLALLYLRDRRGDELRRLAGELYPVFAACDMRHEALMALLVFRRAAESATISVELVVELARYLAGFRIRARSPAQPPPRS